MANGVEPRPPGSADKSLGEIIADITAKLQLLVREEIELAKTEVTIKAKKLGTGAGMAGAALVTLLFFSIFLFFGVAYLLNDLFNWEGSIWAGFLIVAGFFLLLTIVLILVGVRLIKKGSPPAPEMAIAEAKATKAAFDEARS
jgi:uncharacterized membrane protein YozB (DUF420 family)